jgi:hypothetical protein
LQCQVEYHDCENPQAQSKRINSLKSSGNKELHSLAGSFETWTSQPKDFFESQKIILDADNNVKIETHRGYFDASGSPITYKGKTIVSWNGVESVTYHETPDLKSNPAVAIISDKFNKTINVIRTPLRLFGGRFSDELFAAFKANQRIVIENDDTGQIYKITFRNGEKEYRGIIDPSKGYSVINWEMYLNGSVVTRFSAHYEK